MYNISYNISLFKDIVVQINNEHEFDRLATIMDNNNWKLRSGRNYYEIKKDRNKSDYAYGYYDLYGGAYIPMYNNHTAASEKYIVSIQDFEILYKNRTNTSNKYSNIKDKFFVKCIIDLPNIDTIINDFVLKENVTISDIKFNCDNTMAILIYKNNL